MKISRTRGDTKALHLRTVQSQLLSQTAFGGTTPGALLHDLNVVLEFIGAAGVPASGKFGLLPMDAIVPIDLQLSQPLKLDLKRPQLRSHPYLAGLHLLLRASGLTQLKTDKRKSVLLVDQRVFSSWEALNETEQYFALLEAWLLNGDDDMIGGQGTSGWHSMLSTCLTHWEFLIRVQSRKPDSRFFELTRDYHLFALMDLFGFVKIELPEKSDQRWIPKRAEPTPFGAGVFGVLAPWYAKDVFEDEHEFVPGQWQSLFQPYFREWRNNLRLPTVAMKSGTYFFKVYLEKSWRRIAIDAHNSLDDLANFILRAVDFDNDHLYEFQYRNQFGKTVHVNHPEMDDGRLTTEVMIGSLPLESGQEMLFRFDFGDDWHFSVVLEEINDPRESQKLPHVIETYGAAPAQYH